MQKPRPVLGSMSNCRRRLRPYSVSHSATSAMWLGDFSSCDRRLQVLRYSSSLALTSLAAAARLASADRPRRSSSSSRAAPSCRSSPIVRSSEMPLCSSTASRRSPRASSLNGASRMSSGTVADGDSRRRSTPAKVLAPSKSAAATSCTIARRPSEPVGPSIRQSIRGGGGSPGLAVGCRPPTSFLSRPKGLVENASLSSHSTSTSRETRSCARPLGAASNHS